MTTIDIDGESAADGLMTLVLAVVEILVDALEREAIRRMESGRLTDEEVDRLGRQLAAIDEQIREIESDQDIGDDVDRLRGQLDGIVENAIERLDESVLEGDDNSNAVDGGGR
ncbi:gas vesicle protein K [Halovivax gelatinilyticus]|uniref:gas vesicle protein K n=1 Tax=Halovivax gelatinilyticus TaxID=2961597 RepID=UPI0020CA4359|nr:gas vesicle protein K [Halovivax gelatinilyticus]